MCLPLVWDLSQGGIKDFRGVARSHYFQHNLYSMHRPVTDQWIWLIGHACGMQSLTLAVGPTGLFESLSQSGRLHLENYPPSPVPQQEN